MIKNKFASALRLITYSDIFSIILSEKDIQCLLSKIPLYNGIKWIMSLLSQWLMPEAYIEENNRIFSKTFGSR